MKRGISMLILGLAAGAASLTAHAVQAQCVIFDPVVLSGSFDPFNPSGTTVQRISSAFACPTALGRSSSERRRYLMANTRIRLAMSAEKNAVTATRKRHSASTSVA